MAKKKSKKKKPIIRQRITEEEYLERLITASERAISSHGTSIDDYFRQQADRLKKKLADLRKNNGVR